MYNLCTVRRYKIINYSFEYQYCTYGKRGEQRMNDIMRREMQEAIAAGERALLSLRSAREKLDSAGNWGIFDMTIVCHPYKKRIIKSNCHT